MKLLRCAPLIAVAVLLAGAVPAQAAAVCTITGTPGADTLIGTPGPDVICGLGGDDDMNGQAGNDVLLGGGGNDQLGGGRGNDVIDGGTGRDRLTGGQDDDELRSRDLATDAPVTCGDGIDRANIDAGERTAGCETVTQRAVAGLSIALADSPDPARTTQPVEYRATVRNAGPETARAATVELTLPDGASVADARGCTTAALRVTCALGDVPVRGTSELVVAVRHATTGIRTATARVSSQALDYDADDDQARTQTTITPAAADLSLELADDPDPVTRGATTRYTATIANAGPDTAEGVTVIFSGADFAALLPDGCIAQRVGVRCSVGDLAPGARTSVALRGGSQQPGTQNVSATVNAATSDPAPANDSDTESTTFLAAADLAVDLTGPTAPVRRNSPASYTAAITNHGPDPVAPVLKITVPDGWSAFTRPDGCESELPGDGSVLITCTLATTGAGQSVEKTFDIPWNETGQITVPVSVSSDVFDPDTANNADSVTTTVRPFTAELAIDLTGPTAPVRRNSPASYTAAVTNNGPDAVAPVLTVTVPKGWNTFTVPTGCQSELPGDGSVLITCTLPTTGAGQEAHKTFSIPWNDTGQITLPVSVTSHMFDPDTANNADSVTTTVRPHTAELAVDLTGPTAPVRRGTVATYTATVTNNGPDAVVPTLTIDVPDGWGTFTRPDGCQSEFPGDGGVTLTCTLATAAPGQSVETTLDIPWNDTGQITLPVSVTSHMFDPDTANNADSVTTTVRPHTAELGVALTGPAGAVAAGSPATYTAAVTNTGPDAAVPTLTINVPDGWGAFTRPDGCQSEFPGDGGVTLTCTLATTDSGQTTEKTFDIPWGEPGEYTPSATVTSHFVDPDTANNAASTTTTVRARSADLGVTVSDSVDPARLFQAMSYTVRVTNAGPDTASSTQLSVAFPSGATGLSLPSGCSSSPRTGGGVDVTCSLGSVLTIGRTLTIGVTWSSTGSKLVSASVSSATADPLTRNNIGTETTTVNVI